MILCRMRMKCVWTILILFKKDSDYMKNYVTFGDMINGGFKDLIQYQLPSGFDIIHMNIIIRKEALSTCYFQRAVTTEKFISVDPKDAGLYKEIMYSVLSGVCSTCLPEIWIDSPITRIDAFHAKGTLTFMIYITDCLNDFENWKSTILNPLENHNPLLTEFSCDMVDYAHHHVKDKNYIDLSFIYDIYIMSETGHLSCERKIFMAGEGVE